MKALDPIARRRLLVSLVPSLTSTEVRALRESLAQRDLRKDIFLHIPLELRILVASYIDDPINIFDFLRVSVGWRNSWLSRPVLKTLESRFPNRLRKFIDPLLTVTETETSRLSDSQNAVQEKGKGKLETGNTDDARRILEGSGRYQKHADRFLEATHRWHDITYGWIQSVFFHGPLLDQNGYADAYIKLDPEHHPNASKEGLTHWADIGCANPFSTKRCRKFMYRDGRVAWNPAPDRKEPADSTMIVVDNLRTSLRKVYLIEEEDEHAVTLADLGDKMVVAYVHRTFHAWNLETNEEGRVKLPCPIDDCETRGNRVLIQCDSEDLFLWEFGGTKLVPLARPPAGTDRMTQVAVFFHPSPEKSSNTLLSIVFEREHIDVYEHILPAVEEGGSCLNQGGQLSSGTSWRRINRDCPGLDLQDHRSEWNDILYRNSSSTCLVGRHIAGRGLIDLGHSMRTHKKTRGYTLRREYDVVANSFSEIITKSDMMESDYRTPHGWLDGMRIQQKLGADDYHYDDYWLSHYNYKEYDSDDCRRSVRRRVRNLAASLAVCGNRPNRHPQYRIKNARSITRTDIIPVCFATEPEPNTLVRRVQRELRLKTDPTTGPLFLPLKRRGSADELPEQHCDLDDTIAAFARYVLSTTTAVCGGGNPARGKHLPRIFGYAKYDGRPLPSKLRAEIFADDEFIVLANPEPSMEDEEGGYGYIAWSFFSDILPNPLGPTNPQKRKTYYASSGSK